MGEVAERVHLAVDRLCRWQNWMPLHEVILPDGHRADVLALRPDGGFVCIEVKSGVRDFMTDGKWPAYRGYCDAFFFAVEPDFPRALLPDDVGVVVAEAGMAEILRKAPSHPLAPARRRALLHLFAWTAAARLSDVLDPEGARERRSALRVE